jgi:hypothetical protein
MLSASAAVIHAIAITVLTLTIQIKIDVNFIKFMLASKRVVQSFDIRSGHNMTSTVAAVIDFSVWRNAWQIHR